MRERSNSLLSAPHPLLQQPSSSAASSDAEAEADDARQTAPACVLAPRTFVHFS